MTISVRLKTRHVELGSTRAAGEIETAQGSIRAWVAASDRGRHRCRNISYLFSSDLNMLLNPAFTFKAF
jgi:hypothetical protein